MENGLERNSEQISTDKAVCTAKRRVAIYTLQLSKNNIYKH
jgi:hypothetical protein